MRVPAQIEPRQLGADASWTEGWTSFAATFEAAGPALFVLLVAATAGFAWSRRRRTSAQAVMGAGAQALVHAAIADAERRTVGEIVPVVLERSDRFPGASWLSALVVLVLGTLALVGLLPWDEPGLDGFLAIETWGNDNVGLPGAFYEQYIEELYRNDALFRGALSIAGERVGLDQIHCPLLAVTFEDDHIVPWRSAAAILERVASTDKEHLHLRGGHVGAVVSSSAKTRLWPALSDFWAAREPAPADRAARSHHLS